MLSTSVVLVYSVDRSRMVCVQHGFFHGIPKRARTPVDTTLKTPPTCSGWKCYRSYIRRSPFQRLDNSVRVVHSHRTLQALMEI